jgi:hypothetical protein
VIEITPPHPHWHVHVFVSAGCPATIVLAAPGAHGDVVTGTHGCGVKTPCAAAVALATCGFDIDWHIPKGAMLTPGLKSMMFAAGTSHPVTLFAGKTVSDDGAAPNEHFKPAPITTSSGMAKASRDMVQKCLSPRPPLTPQRPTLFEGFPQSAPAW